MSDEVTHGTRRLGLLTSSRAHIIMHGNRGAWEELRKQLWSETADGFDKQVKSGPRAWGHEHEAEGVAKFWERHPEYDIGPGGFHLYNNPVHRLHGWLGSSPDRALWKLPTMGAAHPKHGLEVKSPTSADTFAKHQIASHYDQCQHGILVTGWPVWWLVVHHGDLYKETMIQHDPRWQSEYLRKAVAFWRYCYEDKPVTRRRLSATDL